MTKGCIEYFFLLHYEKYASTITTPADKEKILKNLKSRYCPGYEKGNKKATWEIAKNYITGIDNGNWSLRRIENELSKAKDGYEKYKILYFTDSTFTNAHEAIEYLRTL